MKQMKTKARLFALCLGLLMLAAFAGSVLVVFADADVKAFGDGGHNAQSVPEGKGVVGMHIGVIQRIFLGDAYLDSQRQVQRVPVRLSVGYRLQDHRFGGAACNQRVYRAE